GKISPPVKYRIVGVFHDVLNNDHLTAAMQPEMYITEWQAAYPYLWVAVRTIGMDPASVAEGVRRAVASAESGAAIDHVELMQQIVDGQRSSDRFEMVLFGGFALVALLLAAIGIYGVMSFAVSQRSHEIGVRMALGARRSEVVMLIVRGGMRLALLGIAIGVAGAYGLGRIMQSTLYGVESADVNSLPAVAALLFTVAVLACWIPARRAARVDPMQALRAE
ncbi:MAG: FtsX-like permease family protein, partial [Terracidiphilus sp.]